MINFNVTLIVQIVVFFIFLYLLSKVLYEPVGKLFSERTRRIEEGLAAAERSRIAAEQAQQMIAEQLDQARREAQEILRQASKVADTMRENMTGEARQEAENIVRRAHAEIERERQGAIDDLRREAGHLAILAATKVVGQSLDSETNRRLVAQSLKELQGDGV